MQRDRENQRNRLFLYWDKVVAAIISLFAIVALYYGPYLQPPVITYILIYIFALFIHYLVGKRKTFTIRNMGEFALLVTTIPIVRLFTTNPYVLFIVLMTVAISLSVLKLNKIW